MARFCMKTGKGQPFKAPLQNPVQDIKKVAEGVQGTQVCHATSSILYSPKLTVRIIKSKKVFCEKLKLLNLSVEGTLVSCKERLLKYEKNLIKKYQQLVMDIHSILFYIDEHVGK